jgi:hypothetical protein
LYISENSSSQFGKTKKQSSRKLIFDILNVFFALISSWITFSGKTASFSEDL